MAVLLARIEFTKKEGNISEERSIILSIEYASSESIILI